MLKKFRTITEGEVIDARKAFLTRKYVADDERESGEAKKGEGKVVKFGQLKKKRKAVNEVAPPGREKQVKKLKKKVGSPSAFKIAWWSYKHRKKK